MKSLLLKLLLFTIVTSVCFTSCEKDCTSSNTKNTETVKLMFDYFGKADIPSFLALCTEDCVFDITGNQILNPGKVYIGKNGFMSFLGDLSTKGQPTLINPVDFFESNDVVTVNGNLEFKDLQSGKKCKANFLQIWKFNTEGKMIFFKEDHDHRVCE